MKKVFAFVLLAGVIIIACQKEKSNDAPPVTALSASKTTVAKNETVTVSIQNPPSGNVFSKWTVSPSTGATVTNIYSNNGRGELSFAQAGTYTVTADLRTVHPSCMPSPGFDTCYANKASIIKPTVSITVTN
jgi:hypothetical protein